MAWRTARTLVAQVAEAGAPLAAAFTDMPVDDGHPGPRRYIELSFGELTFAGGVAATSCVLGIWRIAEDRIDKVATVSVNPGANTNNPPLVDFFGDKIHIRVESFPDGTTPNIAGSVVYRNVSP